MILATVHIHPSISITLAAAVVMWLVWYWIRLRRDDVPASRRKIRRWSLVFIAVSLPMFVRALSFIDRAIDPRQYIVTWSMAVLMLLIVIVIAMLDAMNSLRLHQNHMHREVESATRNLMEAIEKRQRASRVSNEGHSPNGKGHEL